MSVSVFPNDREYRYSSSPELKATLKASVKEERVRLARIYRELRQSGRGKLARLLYKAGRSAAEQTAWAIWNTPTVK